MSSQSPTTAQASMNSDAVRRIDEPPSSYENSSDTRNSHGDVRTRQSSISRSRKSLDKTNNESFATGVDGPAGVGRFSHNFTPLEEEDDDTDARRQEEGDDNLEDTPVDEQDPDPPDNSIYPQVRASVSAIDNTALSINTPRMWVLSLLFALLGSATNLFFSLRYPSVTISPIIALIIVHPLGRAWDFLLKRSGDPEEFFEDGVKVDVDLGDDNDTETSSFTRWKTLRLWLAQGRWNEKEHACVYISSNVSFAFAFATDIITEQHKFYHQNVPILYQILLAISTQMLGYAFAGITRQYLVRPPSMIWPGTLMSTAMFTTIHRSDNKVANGWTVSRLRFFVYVWLGSFIWYFMPGLLMPALSYFNVLTWFAPENVVLANLSGVSSGLGLFPVTFDWAQLAYIGSPLLTPWWAAANVFAGFAIVMCIIAPILYYSNLLYTAYMPILSAAVFDNTGKPYDVKRILTSDWVFDETEYRRYSPIFLPVTYMLSYAVQFASLTALVSHTICWHGLEIWQQTKDSFSRSRGHKNPEYLHVLLSSGSEGSRTPQDGSPPLDQQDRVPWLPTLGEDVHNRLMERYEEAPLTWYLAIFVTMLTIAVFLVEYYPIYLPFYGLLLALSITTVLYLPIAIIMAITNQHFSLYLIGQLICGYVFPGRPVANMVFTTYCYISSSQGVKFSGDLKLGHYMKIPPKLLFSVQVIATLVSSLVQIGVLNWMFSNVPGICTMDAMNGFTCPIARVHFNGSILWGVVGPGKFFGPDAMYRHLVWAFAFGAIAPLVLWIIARRMGKMDQLRKVNLPLMFGSLSWIPPATGLNFSGWALMCFLFNNVVRRRANAWWGKYTMTLSAALDSGLAFGMVIAFFVFIFPGVTKDFQWWGTEIFRQGCDWNACPLLKPPENGTFVPPPG